MPDAYWHLLVSLKLLIMYVTRYLFTGKMLLSIDECKTYFNVVNYGTAVSYTHLTLPTILRV